MLDCVLAALANEKRREIVYALGLQPASIGQLARRTRLSLPAIHRHIKVLEEAKLVRRRKSGRVNFLALDRSGLRLVQEWVAQYHAYWGTEEETLENYVASMEKDEKKIIKQKKGGNRMKKFVFVYYGRVRAEDISKEDMQKTMDAWMNWFGTFQDKMVDGGNPFGPVAKSVTKKGVETISADNWPAKGYSIINAKDMDEAVQIAKGCPALKDDPEGAVRVYEAMPM